MAAPADARTLPFSWYTDESILRDERARVFARSWQYGGPRRASRRTRVVRSRPTRAACPIVVTRDRDGELRAFLNVCRHRGAVLTDGCGERATLQCHYHAWTYELDGTLRSAPRSDREPGFDNDEWSLLPASVGTWGPFLFVNPDPGAEPLADHLGELPAILARELDVECDRVPLARRVRCERELEDRRRELPRVLPLPDGAPGVQRGGGRSSRPLRARSAPDVRARSSRAPETATSAASSICSIRTRASTSSPARRTSRSGRSRRTARTGPSATSTTSSRRAWTRRGSTEFFAFDDQVGREDTALVESVHRGMSSGLLEHGRLLLGAEPLLAAFQGWLRERLG